MKKIKTIYPVILLTLLLLVSCKSKKNMVATLPRPVLNSDSIYPDTANAIAGLFSPDHSQLKELNVSKNKKQNTKKKTSTDTHESSDLVLRGTKITSSRKAPRFSDLILRPLSFRLYQDKVLKQDRSFQYYSNRPLITPQTEKPLPTDDFPERFAKWLSRFMDYIANRLND